MEGLQPERETLKAVGAICSLQLRFELCLWRTQPCSATLGYLGTCNWPDCELAFA